MVQEAAVVVIVLGAVGFLVRRLFGRAPDKTAARTFVPIGRVKKPPDRHCP